MPTMELASLLQPSHPVNPMRAFWSCLTLVACTLALGPDAAHAQPDSSVVDSVITSSSNGWTKTCYAGSSECSGGVGENRPLGVPAMRLGMNEPSAATGTSNAVAHFQMVVPNSGIYTEVLWVNTIGKADALLTFTRDFYEKFQPPRGTTNLEWDLYQFAEPDGVDTMLGTQCNGHDHKIQYDNHGHGWVDTKVDCGKMMDGNWHHVHQTFHRDPAGSTGCHNMPCEYWDTIQIDDGGVQNVNAKLPTTRTHWHAFGAQWQIDGRPDFANQLQPAVYDLYVDSDRVTAQ
jgi:hypothetical protein